MRSCPLVVRPGWQHDAQPWEAFRSRFVDRDVHVLDFPGFGKEPLVSLEWGIPEYANWTKTKLDALGYERVILLGHSFGGRVAGLLASENPPWLQSLILYGSPLLYRPTAEIRVRIALAKLLKPIIGPFLSKDFSPNPELSDARELGLEPIFRRTVPFDETNMLPRIKAPTLLLWGEKDASVSVRIAQEAKQLIPQNELVLLPGVGHNAHLERPDLFFGSVSRFLSDHEHDFPLR